MYQTILIPLDGSLVAEQALGEAERVSDRGVRVILLRVVRVEMPVAITAGSGGHPLVGMGAAPAAISSAILAMEEAVTAEESVAEDYLDRIRGALSRRGFADVVCRVVVGSPETRILEAANTWDADVIIMGSRGIGGIRRTLLGSVTDHVVRHAVHTPVLVVHEPSVRKQGGRRRRHGDSVRGLRDRLAAAS